MSQNTLVNIVATSPSTNNNTSQIFLSTSDNESFISSSCASPIVTDACVGSHNVSTTTKIRRENDYANDNQQYSFILNKKTNFISDNSNHISKSNFYTFDMSTKDDEQNIHLSNNHHDIDTLSDAGTYIIDDDDDNDNNSEQKINSSLSFKRYVNKTKARHGTFDIHGLITSTAHTISRPVVDSNIPKEDLSISSSNSSLVSLNDETEENKSSLQQQSQIKPAEAFVISPILKTKCFPQRKIEIPLKSKDVNQISSIRPHSAISNQISSFQRQIISENPQYQRSISTIENKIQTNKSSVLRQQHSNVIPLKSLTNSNNQTNRAVELRRARAQAKIEELAQRTKKQLHKPNHHTNIMSTSWHNQTNKKDSINISSQKQDLSVTRTISSSVYHPSSSKDKQEQKINSNTYEIEGERCDLLRNNGQRLAIKLIQLSSGILEKLKPNDDVSVHELEQLVDQLQTINQTLSSIDASLTGLTKT